MSALALAHGTRRVAVEDLGRGDRIWFAGERWTVIGLRRYQTTADVLLAADDELETELPAAAYCSMLARA